MCVGGIRMSTIATSGVWLRTLRSRSSASPHCPTTSRPASLEQAREALAQQDAVLGDHDAHGISALTPRTATRRAPDPKSPSSASTRSARPRRPEPRSVSAPPIPSSTTSTTTWPFARATSTVADGRVRVLADVREALGHDVVGGDLEPLGTRRSSVTFSRRAPGLVRGELLERDRRARARSGRPDGCRARPRAARPSDVAISRRAPVEARAARRDRRPAAPSSRPSSSDSAISRCCAPSCRLRSSRCRSLLRRPR